MLQCMRPQVTLSGSREIRLDRMRSGHCQRPKGCHARSPRRPPGVSAHGIASIAARPPADSLACNLAALEFDHCRTKHLGPAGTGTTLREGETVAYGDTAFDL